MKIKTKLKLFEEFQTDISRIDTKEIKPTTTKTPIDVRTDVISDVDGILKNLEKLSSQIAEEVIREYELQIESANFLYESSFMEEIMQQFNDMKAYAKLKGSYKGLRQKQYDLEVTKVEKEAEFDSKIDDKIEAAVAQVKKSFDAKKQKITQQPDLPREKKTLARQKIDELWTKQEEKIKANIKEKLGSKKEQLSTSIQQQVDAAKKDLNEFETENKIKSDFLSKQWEVSKTKIDNEQDIVHIENKSEAKWKFNEDDDPEAAERRQKKMEAMQKKLAKEAAEATAKAQDDLIEAQKEADARAQKGDAKTQAANAKLKDYYASVNDLLGVLGSKDMEDYDDAAKLEIKKKRKKYMEAREAMSGTVFVDGGVAADKEEGEELLKTMHGNVDTAINDFKGVLDNFKDIKSSTEKAIATAEENEGEAKEALDLIDQQADPAEFKSAQKAYFEAQIETQKARIADANANNEDTTKFDDKITELEGKIQQLTGNSNTNTDQTATPEEVAQEELGANFNDYTKVTDPDEEETVDDDSGNQVTRKKYKDPRTFKGRDADGNETTDEVTYAKLNDSQSINTPKGKPITESFGFKSASVADKFRKLM
jgi:hypothetical protein